MHSHSAEINFIVLGQGYVTSGSLDVKLRLFCSIFNKKNFIYESTMYLLLAGTIFVALLNLFDSSDSKGG